MKSKHLVCFSLLALLIFTLKAESYAFRVTQWKDVANSYRLEIFEFDVHTQADCKPLEDAFEKDANLIKISTSLKELLANSGKKSISLETREYSYVPYGIIVNTATPFLLSTRDTALESRFTLNGTLAKISENEFTVDYSYNKFAPVAFSVKKKQNITLNKMYFIASTWHFTTK